MNMEKRILTDDVAVFVLEKGSQYKGAISEGKYFSTIISLIEKLLAINNLESEKVGFSATKEDLAAFLADFLYIAEFQNTEFTIQTENTDEYNPDTPVRNE
jgi:hypothetical protein